MLQTLPPEIVERIVKCMLTFPPPPGTKLDTRPDRGVHFHTWNKIYERRHLFRLARTCKYLKSVVDPILYENWACHEKLSLAGLKGPEEIRLHGMNIGFGRGSSIKGDKENSFHTRYFISKPIFNKIHHCLPGPNKKFVFDYDPKFYLVAGYQDIPESALKHVKHLGLVLNGHKEPHSSHLSVFLPKMTSLTQVTIHLEAMAMRDEQKLRYPINSAFVSDFAFIIDLLLKHKGKPLRINFFLKVTLAPEQAFKIFLKMFETEWRYWAKLNIYTLAVDMGLPYRDLPMSFQGARDDLKKSMKELFIVNQTAFDLATGEMIRPGENAVGNVRTSQFQDMMFLG